MSACELGVCEINRGERERESYPFQRRNKQSIISGDLLPLVPEHIVGQTLLVKKVNNCDSISKFWSLIPMTNLFSPHVKELSEIMIQSVKS